MNQSIVGRSRGVTVPRLLSWHVRADSATSRTPVRAELGRCPTLTDVGWQRQG